MASRTPRRPARPRPTSSPRRPRTGSATGARWRPGCAPAPSTTSWASATWSAPGAPLRVLIEQDRLTSAILWGPAGTGKTTLAQVVAATTAKTFVPLSAVNAGVKDVREAIDEARRRLGEQGRGTILFIDEVHRFNKSQQDVLLPAVEEGLRGPHRGHHREPLLRGELAPAEPGHAVAPRAPRPTPTCAEVIRRGLEAEEAARRARTPWRPWWSVADGDARAALGTLEVAVALAGDGPDHRRRRGAGPGRPAPAPGRRRPLRPGERVHQVDAGLGPRRRRCTGWPGCSRRARTPGSSPGASSSWPARTSGWPIPMALVVADAAARAVEFVGLPEAQLNLAQAVVYLACAPKSNRVTVGPGSGPRRRAGRPPGRRPDPPA